MERGGGCDSGFHRGKGSLTIMKTGQCRCGNRIFFNNFACLACRATLGRCDGCGSLASFRIRAEKACCDACQRTLQPCGNRPYQACNTFTHHHPLCRWCQFTTDIPDLSQPANVRHWALMEAAKRRLLLQLEDLALPPFVNDLQQSHPLSFRFLADTHDSAGNRDRMITGHADGTITINLAEADSVHRERTRVHLGEPQRTLIGHLRHEIGHYIEWAWAWPRAPEGYRALFGDPTATDYGEAMQRYYEHPPPADWHAQHVSAYATMHPQEDFAETVNAYLDLMAIATTANDQGRGGFDLTPTAAAEPLVQSILRIVVEVSEYNLDLGLQPLLPERLPPPVIEKLSYVHGLRNSDVVHRDKRIRTAH